MIQISRFFRLAVVAAGVLLLGAGSARADAVSAAQCQRSIVKELAKFTKVKSKILRRCKVGVVKKLDPALLGDCPTTPQDDAINAAAQKMRDKIAAACGGRNKICNAADTGVEADEPLADIGWDIGTCPDLAGEGCTNAIADCNDIGTCLSCIGHESVDKATELYFDLLVTTEFGTGSTVNRCQVRIGKAGPLFLQARAKRIGKCWEHVLAGKPDFTAPPGCPATDAATMAKLATAEHNKIDKICKDCGAGGDLDEDGVCDAPGSGLSPVAIGFEPECPDVTIPGSAVSCAQPVATLQDLIECVDCVTEFTTECATAASIPGLVSYPMECTGVP
jgi:hypothetical protein